MIRRNVDIDLSVAPRTVFEVTAHAIYDIVQLRGVGVQVPVADVRAAVVAAGGRWAYRSTACKALRNVGVNVISPKHRHLTYYVLEPDGDPEVSEAHRRRRVEEFSEWISRERSLVGAVAAAPTDIVLQSELRLAQDTCIAIGRSIGLTLPEIVAEMQVLVP